MEITMMFTGPATRVFPDMDTPPPLDSALTALPGETVSFQIAYKTGLRQGNTWLRVRAESLLPQVCIRSVGLVPCQYPCHPETDGGYERTAPGLFPDPLLPLADGRAQAVAGQWRALWVDAELPEDMPCGEYPLEVFLEDGENGVAQSARATLRVLGCALPPQTLLRTEWFHADCLADHYGVPVRSAAWWDIVRNFVRAAARRGCNTILTPIFTPPLDTAVGGERTTVQLVDVVLENGQYRFGFEALEQWIRLCMEAGIRWFEMAHLFTQWGAGAAPKILAEVEGEARRIFGWDTPATGDAYAAFLRAFLPALTQKLRGLGIAENTLFHISDEPSEDHLEAYRAAKDIVAPLLQGFTIVDALSSFRMYQEGVVEHPVVATDHIGPFLQADVPGLWAYYCTGQHLGVSNRFLGMPLARCRVLGVQLYKFNIRGFLQWGYNFYNTTLSRAHIDPYQVTDAGAGLPGGDPFIVYPGGDGQPVESLRMMAMHHAMQDLRALQLLESLAGRKFVLQLIEDGLPQPLSFTRYPAGEGWLLGLRARVNREIDQRS